MMKPETHLTPANEDYLEAILALSEQHDAVRSVDIASHLNVSRASVNKAMNILRTLGLIDKEPYGMIHLTSEGRLHAKDVLQRHQMIKRFLSDILDISAETAEKDACRMEHVISPETRKKWIAWLRDVLNDHQSGG